MKRILILLALTLPLAACKTTSAPSAPQSLAPGYLNQQDEVMGQTLNGIHQFISSVEAKIAAGYVESPTEKTALNALIATTNAADITYLAYHNGAATQAQAQAQVSQAYLQQQTLAASVSGGK